MIEDSQVLLVLLKMQCKTPLPFTRQECAEQDQQGNLALYLAPVYDREQYKEPSCTLI